MTRAPGPWFAIAGKGDEDGDGGSDEGPAGAPGGVLGREHALTLIARLPGDEVATKADVEGLRADLERFATKDDLKLMSADLRVAMADGFVAQTRTFVTATIGALITVGGLAVAAAKF